MYVYKIDNEPWMSFSVTTYRFRSLLRTFSNFSLMKRRVRSIWKKLDGAAASSVPIAIGQVSPSASPLVPVSGADASAAVILA